MWKSSKSELRRVIFSVLSLWQALLPVHTGARRLKGCLPQTVRGPGGKTLVSSWLCFSFLTQLCRGTAQFTFWGRSASENQSPVSRNLWTMTQLSPARVFAQGCHCFASVVSCVERRVWGWGLLACPCLEAECSDTGCGFLSSLCCLVAYGNRIQTTWTCVCIKKPGNGTQSESLGPFS